MLLCWAGGKRSLRKTLSYTAGPTSCVISLISILREINPKYSLEVLMPKLQSFGLRMQKAVSLEKTLTLGKIEGRRRRGQQRMRWDNEMAG